MFAVKKSEGRGLELENIWVGNCYIMKGFGGSFRSIVVGERIVLEIRDSTMEELGLEAVFHGSET